MTLQILVLAEPMATHLAHERGLVAMSGYMNLEVLLATRRVRAAVRGASECGSGVAEFVGAQRLQVAGAVAALVAQQMLLASVDDHVIVQTVLPFEAFAALGTWMGRLLGVFGRVQVQSRFGGEALVAVATEEGFLVFVANEMASVCGIEC